jgi:hypothetical protein
VKHKTLLNSLLILAVVLLSSAIYLIMQANVPNRSAGENGASRDTLTYTNTAHDYQFTYPIEPRISYLTPQGFGIIGHISEPKAETTSNLLIGIDQGNIEATPILTVDVRENKTDFDSTLDGLLGNRSRYGPPVQSTIADQTFTEYRAMGTELNNGHKVVYYTTRGSKYYVITLDGSELSEQIFSTFRFTKSL